MMTLDQAAEQIARQAYAEVTTEPAAYGIERPWRSVREWIDYELDGDGPQVLMRVRRISFKQAAAALERAMARIATLAELNAKLTEEAD